VKRGDEIVISLAEHNSNLYPWQRLAAARGARVVVLDVDAEGRLLSEAADRALTSRTRLVAISHVSNVLGYVNPVAEICALARKRGVPVLIDGAQSAPHVKIDVRALGCDFLAFSSHKMLGPMGVGVLYVRADRMKEMSPYHVGSNMAHGMDLASATYESGALRFQAGTPNVSGPVALAAAMDVIEGWGFDKLAAHDTVLATHALTRFAPIRVLGLIGPKSPANRVPVFTFNLDGVAVSALVAAADAEGIAIRGGNMAALPLLQKFGATTAARVSAYVYNTTAEIDRLADVLTALASRGA
jgi:cysteine desulfurase/selenocysteine lyase